MTFKTFAVTTAVALTLATAPTLPASGSSTDQDETGAWYVRVIEAGDTEMLYYGIGVIEGARIRDAATAKEHGQMVCWADYSRNVQIRAAVDEIRRDPVLQDAIVSDAIVAGYLKAFCQD